MANLQRRNDNHCFHLATATATGDLVAESLNLGYALSVLLFGSAIAIITICYFYFRLNGILAFWLAYILTRPLGASIGDLLSQPRENRGFGCGTVGTSMLFLSIILSLVIYLTLKQRRVLRGRWANCMNRATAAQWECLTKRSRTSEVKMKTSGAGIQAP